MWLFYVTEQDDWKMWLFYVTEQDDWKMWLFYVTEQDDWKMWLFYVTASVSVFAESVFPLVGVVRHTSLASAMETMCPPGTIAKLRVRGCFRNLTVFSLEFLSYSS